MKYRRKPIEVDAIVWNGYDGVYEVIEEWVHPQPIDRQANDMLSIHTLRGTRLVKIGDWVCRDLAEGDVFPVKAEIFSMLYEEVEE